MIQEILIFLFFLGLTFADTECPYVSTMGDRRSDKSKLRLIQYNVEWLFIDYYSPMNCPGTGCTWVNQSEAETHMDYVAKVVKQLNPDIINFCEVEGCDELNMVIGNIGSEYKGYLKMGTDTGTGQNVGMMTLIDPTIDLYRVETKYEYPISGSQCGYTWGNGTTGVSKHYITQFKFTKSDGTVINTAMISAHLLAYPTDPERCAKRESQAMVLQEQIYKFLPLHRALLHFLQQQYRHYRQTKYHLLGSPWLQNSCLGLLQLQ